MWKKVFSLLFCLLLCIANASATPELASDFGRLNTNSLLLEAPHPNASIIANLWPDSGALLLQRLSISDGGDYMRCAVSNGNEYIEGYVMSQNIQFVSMDEANAIAQIVPASYTRVYSDPNSNYQFPPSIYGVTLIDNYGKNDGKINVYDAPGNHTHRSVTKKGTEAYVHIGEPVTVLVQDNGWCLIEYRTTTGNRRGYIPLDCVPNEVVQKTAFLPKANIVGEANAQTTLVNDTSQTNDNYVIQYLSPGATVTVLAFDHSYGIDWVYIETVIDNLITRGFIPMWSMTLL